MAIEVKCRAKVNLFLRILGRRQDGYHEIETVYHSIDLHDVLKVEASEDISLVCEDPHVPCGTENLAFKAAKRLLKDRGIGARITIAKRIPVAAGLGGGSADAAGALVGIVKLYQMNLPLSYLEMIAAELGADVKFMLRGGCAIGKGKGDELSFLKPFRDLPLLLVVPEIKISTAWAYNHFKMGLTSHKANLTMIADTLSGGRIDQLGSLLYNDFESVVFKRYPIVGQIKHALLEYGAYASLMSGSGPVVFAIFLEEGDAKRAGKDLAKQGFKVIKTAFAQKGVTA